jgi:non-canonical purine NTP pyrophosphatase (RdgB/HAM1 family)
MLVTSNKGKLAEWQRLFPATIKLEAADINLDEIQSLDIETIAIDKAKRAYDIIGKPVLVEDVGIHVIGLGGLPGPLIKFFELAMGNDAIYQLSKGKDTTATAVSIAAYYDGARTITGRGDIVGAVVAPRGTNGFGFDHVFQPDGQTKTFAEMTPAEKDRISHRSQAIKALVAQLPGGNQD